MEAKCTYISSPEHSSCGVKDLLKQHLFSEQRKEAGTIYKEVHRSIPLVKSTKPSGVPLHSKLGILK